MPFAEQQLLAALSVPEQAHEPDQPESCSLPWAAFLALIERYCKMRDWALEYGDVADCSCAIFACEDTLPAAFSEGKEDETEKVLS